MKEDKRETSVPVSQSDVKVSGRLEWAKLLLVRPVGKYGQ